MPGVLVLDSRCIDCSVKGQFTCTWCYLSSWKQGRYFIQHCKLNFFVKYIIDVETGGTSVIENNEIIIDEYTGNCVQYGNSFIKAFKVEVSVKAGVPVGSNISIIK